MGTSVSCASVKDVSSMSVDVASRGQRGNKDTRTLLATNQQSRKLGSTCISRTSHRHFAESERKVSASVKATSMLQFGSKDEERSNGNGSSDLRRCEWQKSKEKVEQLTRTRMSKHITSFFSFSHSRLVELVVEVVVVVV